jgi:hypothetical protein
VGWPSEPTPSRLETTDCSALLLHPTETVRRRLLARASLIIYLTTLGPATDRDSQVNPVGYSYKIACSILILLRIQTPSSSPHSISTPLRISTCRQTPILLLYLIPHTYRKHGTSYSQPPCNWLIHITYAHTPSQASSTIISNTANVSSGYSRASANFANAPFTAAKIPLPSAER